MPEDSNVTGSSDEWPGPSDDWPQFGEGVAAAMRRSGLLGHPLMVPEELRMPSDFLSAPMARIPRLTGQALLDQIKELIDAAPPAPAAVTRADWNRALELLHAVTSDNDSCDFDHHGDCQAHPYGLEDAEGRPQCLTAEAIRFLERVGVKPYPEDFEPCR